MPVISFEDARVMAFESKKWMEQLSDFINNPATNPPQNLYDSQKLAFEIDKAELAELMLCDRVVGVFGKDLNPGSLSVILVGVDKQGKPTSAVQPKETFPRLNTMPQIDVVLETYLTPVE